VVTSLGPLRIGQSSEEVRKLLGNPASGIEQDVEAAGWRENGYDPNREMVFLLGFDEVLVDGSPRTDLPPYWKLSCGTGE
jgi:hypothetical protein